MSLRRCTVLTFARRLVPDLITRLPVGTPTHNTLAHAGQLGRENARRWQSALRPHKIKSTSVRRIWGLSSMAENLKVAVLHFPLQPS